MRASWSKYLHLNVPRYTSYPSALHFNKNVGASDYERALETIPVYEPLSFYVHIPYCRQLCWYCGCTMRVENSSQRALPYIRDLEKEIRRIGQILKGRGLTTQIHFGGGTPNYFEPSIYRRILDCFENHIGLTDQARLAIEMDPRLATVEQVEELAGLGFTRMSLGVQDFDPQVQAAINRRQSYELVESCVSAMRENRIEDISFDLLYGLPYQTELTVTDSINKSLILSPERISLFGYAHLPERLPHQKLLPQQSLPDRDKRIALLAIADAMLVKAGYNRIGFDHFARPDTPLAKAARLGHLNRNFQGFTEDPAQTVLGLGVSAISSVAGNFYQNHKTTSEYARCCASGTLPTERGVIPDPAQRQTAQKIKELLCQGTTAIRFGAQIPPLLRQLLDDRLVILAEDQLTIQPEARPLSRVVAAAIDPAMQAQTSGYTMAV